MVSLCHTGPHTAAHAHTDGCLSAVTHIIQTHMSSHAREYLFLMNSTASSMLLMVRTGSTGPNNWGGVGR